MKRGTTKILLVIGIVGFISVLLVFTSLNHDMNYLPYTQNFESEPVNWRLDNSSLTEDPTYSGDKSLNLSKTADGNWSYSVFDYNFSLYLKEINFKFRFKEIESDNPVDIMSIKSPTGIPTSTDFVLWVNKTHKVAASYNFTVTQTSLTYSTNYSAKELKKDDWNYFSIQFREDDTLVLLNDTLIMLINYSIVSIDLDFSGGMGFMFGGGGGSTGYIYLGKTSISPFDTPDYEMYYDEFEITEITIPIIPGFDPILIVIASIVSIVFIINSKFKGLLKKINNNMEAT